MDIINETGRLSMILYTVLSIILAIAAALLGKIKNLLSHWKPGLILSLVYFVSMTLGTGFSFTSLIWAAGLFLQSLVGFSLAANIAAYQALPVTESIRTNTKPLIKILLMIGISLAAAITIICSSAISTWIGQLLGESADTTDMMSLIPQSRYKAFFSLLAGAGILEGVTYRLIIQSFLQKYIKRAWPAILLSAVIFSLYHFIPLNMMYKTYWQIPVTQLINTLLGGTIIGFIYAKRGFETSILAHTLADFLPVMLMSFY